MFKIIFLIKAIVIAHHVTFLSLHLLFFLVELIQSHESHKILGLDIQISPRRPQLIQPTKEEYGYELHNYLDLVESSVGKLINIGMVTVGKFLEKGCLIAIFD